MKLTIFLLLALMMNIQINAQEADTVKVQEACYIEQMPSFPGGQDSMMSFVKNNLIIPENLKGSGIKGKVFVSFVLTKTGKIEKIQVVKGLNKPINDAVVTMIKKTPNWEPGTFDGKPSAVYVSIPVFIDLTDETHKQEYKK